VAQAQGIKWEQTLSLDYCLQLVLVLIALRLRRLLAFRTTNMPLLGVML
jgi:hypothetical protein